MNDIYKKLKAKYTDYKITNSDEKEMLTITKDEVKVEIYKDTVLLFVNDKCIDHIHTDDIDTEEELYNIIEHYLKKYKEIIERYRKQDIMRKMLFIVPVAVVIIITIILVCMSNSKEKNYYQELKDGIQEDISKYIKINGPYCSVGSASYTIDEEILMVQAGIDKKKFLDIDGKSYCKVKVNVRCVAENEHEWDTYLKCKDYEDEGYN